MILRGPLGLNVLKLNGFLKKKLFKAEKKSLNLITTGFNNK